MKAKIINEITKEVSVALGSNPPQDYVEMDVERAYTGDWYIKGYAPAKPAPTPEEQKEMRIAKLKAQLDGTDYKIIKCSEYSLAGVELPYNVAELHAERQAFRDEINELEAE